jgi:hypothetical protein
MIYINLVYEDYLSEAVMTKLVSHFTGKYSIQNSYSGNGFGYLKSNIKGFNQASKSIPFLMLTDLDNYTCPPELIDDWITFPLNQNFIFRIAVREVESWLMADIEGLSGFLKVSKTIFPKEPEIEQDPKDRLIQIARRSRTRSIRDDIIPINKNAKIGPNYNGRLIEFVSQKWSIENAKKRSISLSRALDKLEHFKI